MISFSRLCSWESKLSIVMLTAILPYMTIVIETTKLYCLNKYYGNVKNPIIYPLLYKDTAQWKVRFCAVLEVLHNVILCDQDCKINHVSTNYTKLLLLLISLVAYHFCKLQKNVH